MSKFDQNKMSVDDLMKYIEEGTDDRIYAIAQLMYLGVDHSRICDATHIDMFFLDKIKNIVDLEKVLENPETRGDIKLLAEAKKMGFSDKYIAQLWEMKEDEVYELRKANNMFPVYKMIDSCAGEVVSDIPYFYSTYEDENESIPSDRTKIVVLGSGPIRIGQGVEFDYSTVHAVTTIKNSGYEAIIINNNPEIINGKTFFKRYLQR